jgi:hypothetical protein
LNFFKRKLGKKIKNLRKKSYWQFFFLSESPESSAQSRSSAFKSKLYGIALESTVTRIDADYDVLFMLRLIMALITD